MLPKLKQELNKLGIDGLVNSKIHGLNHIGNSPHAIYKLMWSLFVLLSICGCAFLIGQSLALFLSFEVITKTRTVEQSRADFPAVYFCNRYNSSHNALRNLLFSCNFKVTVVTQSGNCGNDVFVERLVYGEDGLIRTCYEFNSGTNASGHPMELYRSQNVGFNYGLHVYFYIPPDDFINIYIGNQTYKPLSNEIYRILDSGYTSALIIEKNVEKKLDYPYNLCEYNWDYGLNQFFSKELIGRVIGPERAYRKVNCINLCAYHVPLESLEECAESCPLECETISYDIDFQLISYRPDGKRFDSNKAAIELRNGMLNTTDDVLRTQMLSLYVYYSDLSYTEITQIPKITVTDLISNVGGALSLMLGISVVSLMEPIAFLVQGFFLKRRIIED